MLTLNWTLIQKLKERILKNLYDFQTQECEISRKDWKFICPNLFRAKTLRKNMV